MNNISSWILKSSCGLGIFARYSITDTHIGAKWPLKHTSDKIVSMGTAKANIYHCQVHLKPWCILQVGSISKFHSFRTYPGLPLCYQSQSAKSSMLLWVYPGKHWFGWANAMSMPDGCIYIRIQPNSYRAHYPLACLVRSAFRYVLCAEFYPSPYPKSWLQFTTKNKLFNLAAALPQRSSI